MPPIQAEKVSDQDYAKIAKYSEVSKNEPKRGFLKICGHIGGNLEFVNNDPTVFAAPVQTGFKFDLTKPLQIVDPDDFSTIETIPMEWFL